MTRQGLAELWRKRLDDCAKSGESVVYWCYLHKVEPHQYYYWKRRLAGQQTQPTAKQAFLPVDIVDTSPRCNSTTGLTVRIAGATIDVTAGFDPALLRAVVGALADPPC
jgi:hypothetical protein